MAGPAAPKDPNEKRPGFYVLLDKQVGGIPQDDGKGRHSIFISSDRLPSFARVTGGVEDESILELLKDAAGFRKLVHSIGVSISAGNPAMEVGFSLICKGSGGPGSCHRFTFPADGAERVITLGALAWSEFDTGLGEFRFELPTVADMATVSVKCYVNDGFAIPDQDPDPAVDTESPRYREMIARSFLSAGNNARLQSFLRRAKAGEEVTVAFLGGSITQGAGAVPLQENCYAKVCCDGLRRRYGENIRYIKAGVGGTPSETGLMRYRRDITREGAVEPDLVVVEFAVNDAGDETEGVFYESLVRHILNGPGRPAVILLFAVFADDWNLKRRLAPIGYRYQLPMVDVLEAVSPQFRNPENRVITKRQYFYDVYHPSNLGHRIMADCLLYLIDRLDNQQPEEAREDYVPPYYGADYEQLVLLDRKTAFPGAVIIPGSFTETDTDLQAVPLDDDRHNTPMFPYNWKKGPGSAPFVLELPCRRLVLEFKDSGAPAFGKALVTIDGEKHRLLDPTEAGWTHCHTTVLFNKQETAKHRIEITMAPGDEEKIFTILGFGVVK
ncbi:MAG: SGNH/GDSL hydrolase family protein [Faecousia sp.]